MDCRELERRFEALLEGTLDAVTRERCERHLEDCPACRDLGELLDPGGAVSVAPVPNPVPDLVDGVLDRTTGPLCRQVEDRLGEFVDGFLPGDDRELVALHLETCGGCRDLAVALEALALDLPRLATLQPDPAFVEGVLAASLPVPDQAKVPVRSRSRWSEIWQRWLRRPRFTLELAYFATLILVLVFGAPGSPLGAMPQRALEIARTDPIERLEGPAAALEERTARGIEELKSSKTGRAVAGLRGDALELIEEGRDLAAAAGGKIGTFWESVSSLLERADEDPPTDTRESI